MLKFFSLIPRLKDNLWEDAQTFDSADPSSENVEEEGIFVGISSGASLGAVAKELPEMPAGSTVLTFGYDTGECYLSVEGLFP